MSEAKPSGPGPRVVVITGASAGVGRAAARAFAKEGARVALLARGVEGLEAAKREVESLGGVGLVVQVDVADADAVEAAAERVERELGPIDVWVNNAMTAVLAPVKETTAEEFRRVTEVTYLGYVHGTLSALKRMLPRDRGVIVQVGSALAYRGIPLQATYCAAKHAVQGFCDSLRCELLRDKSGVAVTMLQMPALNTPQFDQVRSKLPRKARPVAPVFQPEVAADAIVFASRHPRREFWVGWPSIKAIVGNYIAPGFADRYLAATGFDGQQTDEPADPDRPDDLFSPVPRDLGAHGRFDDEARARSVALALVTHRAAVAAALGAVVIAAVVVAIQTSWVTGLAALAAALAAAGVGAWGYGRASA